MTARLRVFDEAAAEVEHEREWYRGRSETAESAFLRELEQAISAVVQSPYGLSTSAALAVMCFPRSRFRSCTLWKPRSCTWSRSQRTIASRDTGGIDCGRGVDEGVRTRDQRS